MGNHLRSPGGNRNGIDHVSRDIVGERCDQSVLDRSHLLSSQCGGCHLNSNHGTVIPRLTVEDAGEGFPDLGFAWIGIPGDELLGGEDLSRCRVSRLDGAGVDKGRLNGVQAHPRCQALHRFDLMTVRLSGQHDLGRKELAVDEHRVGAGFSGLRTKAHAVVAVSSEHGLERLVGLTFQDP